MYAHHSGPTEKVQYIPRNMHTVFALLCFVVVIHWLIFPYPSGLLHWHCGNLTIAPVPAKQPWWIWINTSCEFIMNDCIITTKQSTTKPCAYFLGYTVQALHRSPNMADATTDKRFSWQISRIWMVVFICKFNMTCIRCVIITEWLGWSTSDRESRQNTPRSKLFFSIKRTVLTLAKRRY